MRALQLRKYKKMLEIRRRELFDEARSHLSGLQLEGGGDRMDQIRVMVERDSEAAAVRRVWGTLTQIDDALRRIDRGSYGACQACGAELPRKRMEILPWARYCVDCQELAERARTDVAPPEWMEALAS